MSGSTFPIVRTGDTVDLEGTGFGTMQGSGGVTFIGPSGPAPAGILSWADDQIIAVVPDGAGNGSLSVTPDTGATLAPVPVRLKSAATFSLSTFTWTAGPDLPTPSRGLQLAALTYPADTGLTARLHATGGTDGTNIQVTSLFSVSGSNGPGEWVGAVDNAPASNLYSGAAAATQATARLRRHPNRDSTVEGVSYLVGGIDAAGRVTADLYGMSAWENGDQGAWTRLVAMPEPRAASSAAVAYGNLYVIGGFGSDSIALNSSLVAVVDSFGAPAGWLDGPPLPEGRAFAAAVVHDHVLYVLGGETGHVDPSVPDTTAIRADVFAIRLSPLTGFFLDSGWQTLGSALLKPRSRHAAFDVDAGILVAVGVTSSPAESEFAPFAGGTLGAFVPIGGPTIASVTGASISEAGAASYFDNAGVPHVVLAGGVSPAGTPSARVWWH